MFNLFKIVLHHQSNTPFTKAENEQIRIINLAS